MSEELNINIHTGADFAFTFVVKDEYYQPVDLTGAVVEGQVRQFAEAAEYYPFECSYLPAAGKICLRMTFEETMQIHFENGVYDVFVTYSDGSREKVLSGAVIVNQAVTRTIETTMMYLLSVPEETFLPLKGSANRLYFCYDSNIIYRWDGTEYVSIQTSHYTVTIGTVSTLPAGSAATVENVGDMMGAILNIGLPQGEKGDTGATGPQGPKGETGPAGAPGINTWGDITGDLTDQTDLKTALDGKAAASHNHDSAYAAKSHNHDERYYTESEVNTLLSGKSDTGHTHDESQVEHHTYYVKGTQTAVTGAWTGELPEVDALYNGLTIDYWLPFGGSGNATLNLTLKGGTKTGEKNCYRDGTNRLTTQIGANAIARLVYQTVTISGTSYSGWWLVRSQDNNDLAYNIRNGSPAYLANSAVYRYQLLFQVDDNKLTPLNNVNNDQGTSKAMLTGVDFLPFGKIFYYNSTTNVAANANMTTTLYYRMNFDLRYSLNCGKTLTANQYVYLKCVRQSSGKFRIAADPCWTQTLPSTNDGYYYIRLGRTYSTYQMYLDEDHPIYYHDGTALRFYTDPAKAVPFITLTGSPTDNSALNTALNAKANTADLGEMAAVDDAPSDGKEYLRKNGAWAEPSGGGSIDTEQHALVI